MYHKIEDGAIFISDVHFNSNRLEFLKFLKLLDSGELKTTQLILFGDIFDLLVYQVKYTIEFNKEAVGILNALSKKMEIIYFEGNHDFSLKGLFERVIVFSIEKQPQLFEFNSKILVLSHGDIYTDLSYKLYSKVIRNGFLLRVLNFIDTKFFKEKTVKYIFNWLKQKKICRKFDNFHIKMEERLRLYKKSYNNIDFIIEGHFHQDKNFSLNSLNCEYINLPSFACEKSFFIIKSTLEEKIIFSKVSLRSFNVSEQR